MPPTAERQILTPAETGRLIGRGTTTVREWLERGILPGGFRVDSRWYVRRGALLRWLEDTEAPDSGHEEGRLPAEAAPEAQEVRRAGVESPS